MRTNTKRYYVEQLYSNDFTLSKTKLFKMKLAELESLFNNLNIKPSTSDDYSRANFEDISDDEEAVVEEAVPEEAVPEEAVPEVVVEVAKEVAKEEEVPIKKFNRRELKNLFLNDFNKDVVDILTDLDEGLINEDIAISEYHILHEEVLGDIETYTENLKLSERDIDYIDNFFELQERRFFN
tara:strand:+ start:220 stop:765 length:546 start_codon:yes stop_codon:yes gene_type:complete